MLFDSHRAALKNSYPAILDRSSLLALWKRGNEGLTWVVVPKLERATNKIDAHVA